MCEPEGFATNSYVKDSPGMIGFGVTHGTPSMALGPSWPWKWMPVDSSRSLRNVARTLSPSTTRSRGPGQGLLKPTALTGGLTASIFQSKGEQSISKTFQSPSIVGASGSLAQGTHPP